MKTDMLPSCTFFRKLVVHLVFQSLIVGLEVGDRWEGREGGATVCVRYTKGAAGVLVTRAQGSKHTQAFPWKDRSLNGCGVRCDEVGRGGRPRRLGVRSNARVGQRRWRGVEQGRPLSVFLDAGGERWPAVSGREAERPIGGPRGVGGGRHAHDGLVLVTIESASWHG